MHLYFKLFLFSVGFVAGAFLAVVYVDLSSDKDVLIVKNQRPFVQYQYEDWFKKQGLRRENRLWDELRYENKSQYLESNYLFGKISVLCVILVKFERNVKAANETWAKGCNGIDLLYLQEKNRKLPGKRTKEKAPPVLLCNNLLTVPDKYDWVLVVYDDTFVIMENLRYFLAPLNAKQDYYLGHTVTFWSRDYNLGQAGYVISKGALDKLKSNLSEPDACFKDLIYYNKEDFYIGKQLGKLNISPSDTRDLNGLSTFFPYNWYHVFFPGETYFQLSKYPVKCCSERAISFNAIEGHKMYTYYYLFYTLQQFIDGKNGNIPLINKDPEDKVWKSFLKERNIPSDHITSYEYYKVWEDLVEDPNSFAKNLKREEHSDL
ncbi:unnamed protein product [Brassicogethes aeneus]|uniref:Uncharacterized protein n=1 Tax=Brassicogethes aeneus TaxID=1431903 RepID=A0A9P0B1Y8_BRAAE|nr:unnamed protein product [Brassicogethes aeneus]